MTFNSINKLNLLSLNKLSKIKYSLHKKWTHSYIDLMITINYYRVNIIDSNSIIFNILKIKEIRVTTLGILYGIIFLLCN